jgi:sulfite reductase alpha subunit-like flavoprotein
MGNSEGAAKEFCRTVQEMFTPDFFQQQKLPPIEVKTTCIQLDDFLELNHANFTKCLVIFVSSYGVGQGKFTLLSFLSHFFEDVSFSPFASTSIAPLGAYRFRELCDNILEEGTDKIYAGLRYALCGLGDSSYPTYLKNPTTIDKGLTAAGANRIGSMGKANANAMGEDSQDKVIEKWVQDILPSLANALADDTEVDTASMQSKTIPLLMKLDPDYSPSNESDSRMLAYIGLGTVLVGAVAAVAANR